MAEASRTSRLAARIGVLALVLGGVGWLAFEVRRSRSLGPHPDAADSTHTDDALDSLTTRPVRPLPGGAPAGAYEPRPVFQDSSGFGEIYGSVRLRGLGQSLEDVRLAWEEAPIRRLREIEELVRSAPQPSDQILALGAKASALNYLGNPRAAYASLEEARERVERDAQLAKKWIYAITFFQGVTALRSGEDDNCVQCAGRADCVCILPLAPSAVHQRPEGARLAVGHFTEYLHQFPDDLEVRWLLNLSHMALGEHPEKVDPRFLLSLAAFESPEHGIGRFRNVGARAQVDRFNEAGGAIFEDFDGDGRLDLAVTAMDPSQRLSLYRNRGDGTFDDVAEKAGVADQLGGLNCVQCDYDNDGNVDIFVMRGAWFTEPVRPSLLRNLGGFKFVDVTKQAGLEAPANSNAAQWADYDNDGWPDLFVCCERQPNRLYRNLRDGTFADVTVQAGLDAKLSFCKGCTWIDIDNDRYPDLFLNDLGGVGRLFSNRRDGTFAEVSTSQGIDGPMLGFSCWSWDFDNDGWLDILATCYDRTLADVVRGLTGEPRKGRHTNRLFRNNSGKGFKDVTSETGLDVVWATMGSNYGDFDGDGYLDFYLATGAPELSMLVPNRMLRNLGGKRFAEITASSGTGHLQKGHGVACGDWDRDGDLDLFVQTGGAVYGDRAHNALFENPGQGNHVLTVKLVGTKSNRSALGARIKAVTDGPDPLTVHRHVSSGSSFGANPLEQALGLGRHTRVARLEIYWPTSDTTQVFLDVAADQVIRIVELEDKGPTQIALHRVPPPSK